jgi:hypothetical protein
MRYAEIIYDYIDELKKDLSISCPVRVVQTWMPINQLGAASYVSGVGYIMLNEERAFTFEDAIDVLAHEMYHIWQMERGILKLLPDGIEYHGIHFASHEALAIQHYKRPWEIEANKYGNNAVGRFAKRYKDLDLLAYLKCA